MATAQEILANLVEMDAALINEYDKANTTQKTIITRCRSAIKTTAYAIIGQDLLSRSDQIDSLAKSLKGAAQTLRELASSLKKITEQFKLMASIINTAQRLISII